jgi:hypothetical protein
MRFNPLMKAIYTDSGDYVQTKKCLYKMRWDKLDSTISTKRKCTNFDQLILDTAELMAEDLLQIVKQNPDTFLKIYLNQQIIKLMANGIWGQK